MAEWLGYERPETLQQLIERVHIYILLSHEGFATLAGVEPLVAGS